MFIKELSRGEGHYDSQCSLLLATEVAQHHLVFNTSFLTFRRLKEFKQPVDCSLGWHKEQINLEIEMRGEKRQ